MQTSNGQQPPAHWELNDPEVHIWQARLEYASERLASFRENLSTDEIQRADRFLFQKDREQFIISHGILRAILSRYLKTPPQGIAFTRNRFGKPFLAEPLEPQLQFNLSHSNNLGLYAVSRYVPIGIDVEHIKPKTNVAQIVERFFSEDEKREFRDLPDPLKTRAFFNGWARKEAYIKARGSGLSIALHKFSVDLHPDRPAVLLRVDPDLDDGRPWSIHEIPLGQDYAAAIAVAGPEVVFKYGIWTAP